MKKISARWFACVSLIITVAVVGIPLAGHAAPEVVAWGDNTYQQADVPSGLSNGRKTHLQPFHLHWPQV